MATRQNMTSEPWVVRKNNIGQPLTCVVTGPRLASENFFFVSCPLGITGVVIITIKKLKGLREGYA